MTMFVPSSTTQMLSSRVDADGVRELEAVDALADLADVGAVLIELEQPRVAAARVDEHVPLRVGGDADAFAEVEIRRQLEEVRHRGEGNLRDVLGLGFGLREENSRAEARPHNRGQTTRHKRRRPPDCASLNRLRRSIYTDRRPSTNRFGMPGRASQLRARDDTASISVSART